MIFGIGSDIVEYARIERAWLRWGERFAARILTPVEREQFGNQRNPARFLARRFAAKEAISKALGTGFSHGICLSRLGLAADAWGKPQVRLEPAASQVARRLGAGRGFVTLTDEREFVIAFAVFESL